MPCVVNICCIHMTSTPFSSLDNRNSIFLLGNSASPISRIPGGAVSPGASPTHPPTKSGHRTPGTLIKLSLWGICFWGGVATDHNRQLASTIQNQPARGFLPPRLPELPWSLASWASENLSAPNPFLLCRSTVRKGSAPIIYT